MARRGLTAGMLSTLRLVELVLRLLPLLTATLAAAELRLVVVVLVELAAERPPLPLVVERQERQARL